MSKNSSPLLFACILSFLGLLVVPGKVQAAGPIEPFHFRAFPGSTPGTVALDWVDTDQVDDFDIAYGVEPGKYIYGVQNIHEQHNTLNMYTIGSLVPGKTYYFKLVGEQSGHYVSSTGYVATQAAPGVVAQSPTTIMTPPMASALPNPMVYQNGPVGRYQFAGHTGVKSGTVDLLWVDNAQTSGYSVVYGTQPGHYQFGALHLKEHANQLNQFTVGALNPGQTYYFALVGEVDGRATYTSEAVAVVAR